MKRISSGTRVLKFDEHRKRSVVYLPIGTYSGLRLNLSPELRLSPGAWLVLELKVPPPVVALCPALVMWFALSLGQLEVPLQVRVGMALVLVLIGQSISIAGMVAFRRARTTINPIKASAASSLVTTGWVAVFCAA